MCENEIQIEIEKGNPKTIMNLNNKQDVKEWLKSL